MSYVINYYGGIITIPVNTANTTATPLTLIGRNWTSSNNQQGFGQALNQNFVSLLENFANSAQPNSPLKGQFWYDTTTSRMKWNDGTPASPIWSTVANAAAIDQMIGNGTSNVDIPVANGNINLTVGGISNVVVVTTTGANITGNLDVTAVNTTTVTATTLNAISQITSDTVIANTIQSTINDGITQPFTVATTVKVGNLNADLLDGYNASNVRNTVNSVVVSNVSTGLIDNDINGNISGSFGNISTINTGAINSSGTVNFATATQVSLGPIGNVQITGGASGQVLTTDGGGVLSWVTVGTGSLSNGASNVSIPIINGNINSVVSGTNRLIVNSTGANVIGNLNVTGSITGTGANVIGNLNATGGITGTSANVNGNLNVTGRIIGTSGANITGNLNVTGKITGTSANVNGNLNVTGNITSTSGTNIIGNLNVTDNITGASANVNGNLNVTGTSNLGAVGNVKITGGTAGSILSTDGAGNLAWIVISAIYPIGSIYINSDNTTNPATFFGFGTWVPFGAGRVMVGLDATDPLFDTLEETGGSKDATLVGHDHTYSGTTSSAGAHVHTMVFDHNQFDHGITGNVGDNGGLNPTRTSGSMSTEGDHTHTYSGTTNTQGSSATNNNLQPYITVAMWKRTA